METGAVMKLARLSTPPERMSRTTVTLLLSRAPESLPCSSLSLAAASSRELAASETLAAAEPTPEVAEAVVPLRESSVAETLAEMPLASPAADSMVLARPDRLPRTSDS